MGIKHWIAKQGGKAGDKVAKLSSLSPEQIKQVVDLRDEYFYDMATHDPNDIENRRLTEGLLASAGIEIFNAYLPQISELYVPVDKSREPFDREHNIRFFNITKWVVAQDENSLEKLVNVYAVLSDEPCNIALVFHRSKNGTEVYLAITNTENANSNTDADRYARRLREAVKGNFPGSSLAETGMGVPPCLQKNKRYSVAAATNIPTEKSEKFISQTIEKLLDGIVPENPKQEYTLILLATPIQDIDTRKLRLAELYSALAPYAGWQTNFTYTESNSTSSTATFGVNAGVSAGVQNGANQSVGVSNAESENESRTKQTGKSQTQTDNTSDSHQMNQGQTTTDSISQSTSRTDTHSTQSGTTHTDSKGSSDSLGGSVGIEIETSKLLPVSSSVSASANYDHTWNRGTSDAVSESISDAVSNAVSNGTSKSIANIASHTVGKTVGKAVSNATSVALSQTLGRAVTNTLSKTAGVFKSFNLGGNFGVNFARSSTVTATIGKNEGITQNFTNYTIKHALELLEQQMQRFEQSTALGMWDFAAYVLSEDTNVANNVAHTYLALTQGEQSHLSRASVNLWRGDLEKDSEDAQMICDYLQELRHPEFVLNPLILQLDYAFFTYPPVVTATTSLSGKELAYSLNFPRKSVAGLPVLTRAEFGRNITTYTAQNAEAARLLLGKIYHMHREEPTNVMLSKDSLTSHVFVTGSTGTGKSNTVYQLLWAARQQGTSFLVIEPAKGEYKHIFGNAPDVSVFGTNPNLTPLLQINPFSFPAEIHVLEHIDRLVELFNVCWPMYAAMPAVLKAAVEQAYKDCGWDLTESLNPFGEALYPTFADVTRNVKQIIDSSEYDAENKGAYKGSLLTRLQSLTNGINGMIFSTDEIHAETLFDSNVIVDLSRVGSSETKSLLMGLLVLKLQEYRMSSGTMNAGLRHLTVLEEAHHLLKRTATEQSDESSNLIGKSVEMLTNAIAEMRTYGEGFVIADQAPELLDPAVIRNTNTKIILRLPDLADRELVGRAANLDDEQIAELARLPQGVAVIYQNEWVQPVLCKVQYFPVPSGRYAYVRERVITKPKRSKARLDVAELLSKGTAITQEQLLRDIAPRLSELRLAASVQVAIMKMLQHPPKEPRMTKLAPLMSALFPDARAALAQAYADCREPREWTYAVEDAIASGIYRPIEAKVRQNIVQAIVTDYVYCELGKVDVLKEWSETGGLR